MKQNKLVFAQLMQPLVVSFRIVKALHQGRGAIPQNPLWIVSELLAILPER